MARKTKVISISVAEELDRMAEEKGVSGSELVRLMARSYRRVRMYRWLEENYRSTQWVPPEGVR